MIGRIRGDRDDVFSHGFICPKGSTLKQLHEDPDRLRTPLIAATTASCDAATWDEAFAEIERRSRRSSRSTGATRSRVYLGNPTVHSLVGVALQPLRSLQALGTTQPVLGEHRRPAPQGGLSGLMFGTSSAIPVPDLDRTDYLLMLGANPYASNGSLCTAPDWPGRLEAHPSNAAARVVVVDPRRTQTAEAADEHVAIRPGTDALPAAGDGARAVRRGPGRPRRVSPTTSTASTSVSSTRRATFTPEAVAPVTGIDAETIRRLAHELAAAPTRRRVRPHRHVHRRSSARSRAGSSTCSTSLTGNLDRPGGAMFAGAALGAAQHRGAPRARARRHVRPPPQPGARACPRALGELPVVCAGRGDRDAGRRADPGADHGGRQPGAVDAQQRAGSMPRSTSSSSWCRSTSTSTRRPATPT